MIRGEKNVAINKEKTGPLLELESDARRRAVSGNERKTCCPKSRPHPLHATGRLSYPRRELLCYLVMSTTRSQLPAASSTGNVEKPHPSPIFEDDSVVNQSLKLLACVDLENSIRSWTAYSLY